MDAGKVSISTFPRETRYRSFNHSYSDTSDKDNMLWCGTDHPLSRHTSRLHPTRVWKHLLAYKDTCHTQAINLETGSGTC